MAIRTFTKEFMQGVVYEDHEDVEIIETNLIDQTRWSTVHYMVFKYQDKFYESTYCRGATEMQDEQPYEYDSDTIKCAEVKPVEVTKEVWVAVK